MTIICDSREKKNEHIKKYFDKNNIDYIVQKMGVADYQILENDKIVIDRKQNLDELAKNLMNKKDHSRFWKEVRRAKNKGIKLIVLCEHGKDITNIESVSKWNSKHSGITGRILLEEIYRVHIAYGVEFIFCTKRQTAKKIVELLKNY